ncbi:hypothetical protein BAUCODRAFT_31904 [Baudoinia panamericana UAMH 10762]|uniref:Uncharacterized protein n=1 Tax=Baudoinia panamericana (strain UAMH 10762) TaxID=717646 RepID=M2NFW6_BAUPA|nr:uncharacterized protein BAUCODRAFT_31904 [Baudoinia panamericana UAMH 10762]EMC97890.1 hypothetical protein BAUCODRAFT_31904 [Baudoinia panamericana UAMH 10762]
MSVPMNHIRPTGGSRTCTTPQANQQQPQSPHKLWEAPLTWLGRILAVMVCLGIAVADVLDMLKRPRPMGQNLTLAAEVFASLIGILGILFHWAVSPRRSASGGDVESDDLQV